MIDDRAFDREHLQLGYDAAIGGEASGLAAGGEHAVTCLLYTSDAADE